jgi:hypothetical protein
LHADRNQGWGRAIIGASLLPLGSSMSRPTVAANYDIFDAPPSRLPQMLVLLFCFALSGRIARVYRC